MTNCRVRCKNEYGLLVLFERDEVDQKLNFKNWFLVFFFLRHLNETTSIKIVKTSKHSSSESAGLRICAFYIGNVIGQTPSKVGKAPLGSKGTSEGWVHPMNSIDIYAQFSITVDGIFRKVGPLWKLSYLGTGISYRYHTVIKCMIEPTSYWTAISPAKIHPLERSSRRSPIQKLSTLGCADLG